MAPGNANLQRCSIRWHFDCGRDWIGEVIAFFTVNGLLGFAGLLFYSRAGEALGALVISRSTSATFSFIGWGPLIGILLVPRVDHPLTGRRRWLALPDRVRLLGPRRLLGAVVWHGWLTFQ